MITTEQLQDNYNSLSLKDKKLAIEEISKHFNLSKSTIQCNWISKGNIPKGIYYNQIKQDISNIINQLNKQ